jgi:hypothetical protein
VLLLSVLLLFAACATNNVVVTKPTVVVFVDTAQLSTPDAEIALDDFEHYLPSIRQVVQELGARLQRANRFPLRVGERVVDTTIETPLGFVLATPGRAPLVLFGVQTDADFACAARAYFGGHTILCPDV